MSSKMALKIGILIFLVSGAVGIGYWRLGKKSGGAAPVAKGDLSPSLEMRTIDGKNLDFPDGRFPYTLVVFWASWCAPCAQETPSLTRFARKNPTWSFLLVSADSTLKEIKDFLKIFPDLHQSHIQIVWDKDRSLSKAFSTSGLPESFLIDRQGRLVEKFVGSRDWETLQVSN